MATHSSILAWEIPWSLMGYRPWGCRIGHNLATEAPPPGFFSIWGSRPRERKMACCKAGRQHKRTSDANPGLVFPCQTAASHVFAWWISSAHQEPWQKIKATQGWRSLSIVLRRIHELSLLWRIYDLWKLSSICSSQTSNINITWNLVWNENWVPPKTN